MGFIIEMSFQQIIQAGFRFVVTAIIMCQSRSGEERIDRFNSDELKKNIISEDECRINKKSANDRKRIPVSNGINLRP